LEKTSPTSETQIPVYCSQVFPQWNLMTHVTTYLPLCWFTQTIIRQTPLWNLGVSESCFKNWGVVGPKDSTDGGTQHRFEGIILGQFYLIICQPFCFRNVTAFGKFSHPIFQYIIRSDNISWRPHKPTSPNLVVVGPLALNWIDVNGQWVLRQCKKLSRMSFETRMLCVAKRHLNQSPFIKLQSSHWYASPKSENSNGRPLLPKVKLWWLTITG